MNEVWKDIMSYEGLYQVSSLGRVKSLPRRSKALPGRITKERLLKPVLNKPNGYMQVGLFKETKLKMTYIHQLVAKHFISNEECKSTVNHIDGRKDNNTIDNLEWATHSEQNLHRFRVLDHKNSENVKKIFIKNNIKSVNQIDLITNEIVKTWESMKQIQETLGIHYMMISKCCRGIKKTARGFKWEYANE